MQSDDRRLLADQLQHGRATILQEVAQAEEDLHWIAEDRESELEERAQEECAARLLARLDDLGRQEIEEINDALRRLSSGSCGVCRECGASIPIARLRALPAARLCIGCARREEGVP